MEQTRFTEPAGAILLEAYALRADEGLCVYVGGGRTHMGSVCVSQPRNSLAGDGVSCTSCVINYAGHKDEAVARAIAERLCVALAEPVVVTAGVHLNGADAEDIRRVLEAAERLAEQIVAAQKTGRAR